MLFESKSCIGVAYASDYSYLCAVALLPHPLDCELLEGTVWVLFPLVLAPLAQYLQTPSARCLLAAVTTLALLTGVVTAVGMVVVIMVLGGSWLLISFQRAVIWNFSSWFEPKSVN